MKTLKTPPVSVSDFAPFRAALTDRIRKTFPVVGELAMPFEYCLPDWSLLLRCLNFEGTTESDLSDAVIGIYALGGAPNQPDGSLARRFPFHELTDCLWSNLEAHFGRGTPLFTAAQVTNTPLPGGPPTLSETEILARANADEEIRCDGATAYGDKYIVETTNAHGQIARRRATSKDEPGAKVSDAYIATRANRLFQFSKARDDRFNANIPDDTLFVAVAIHGVLDGFPGACLDSKGTLDPIVFLSPAQACKLWAVGNQRFAGIEVTR